MNCELIFYLANRTAANESALRKLLARAGVEIQAVAGATNEGELRYALKQAVDHSNLVFVIGGREAPGEKNAVSVLNRALTAANLKKSEGKDWLLLQSGRQTILSLPDEPGVITGVMEERLLYTLSARYSLPVDHLKKPDIPRDWTLPLEERPGPEAPGGEIPALAPPSEGKKPGLPVWAAVAIGAAVVAGIVLCAVLLF